MILGFEIINGLSIGFELCLEDKAAVFDFLIFRFVVLWGNNE